MSPEERRNMRRQQIEQFLASDMSVGEWTKLNHMSQSTFYLWLRRFQQEEPGSFGGESTQRGGWIELSRGELRGSVALAKREGKAPATPAKPAASTPMQGQPSRPGACVRIALNGADIEIPAGGHPAPRQHRHHRLRQFDAAFRRKSVMLFLQLPRNATKPTRFSDF